jgi:multiple antibiotic resistance protein
MELLFPYLKALVLVPLTLLPIINPLAGAPVFMTTAGPDDRIIKRLARQVALNCWVVLVLSMLIGTYVLELFGISLPIVRIGGGLLVAATGWKLLNSRDDDAMRTALAEAPGAATEAEIVRRSFFPVTFPLTTGPGSIAAAIALGAQWPSTPMLYVAAALVASAGALITALVIYLVYRNAARLLSRMGEVGVMVMTRLLAFILLCIGIEIMWLGWVELNQLPLR